MLDLFFLGFLIFLLLLAFFATLVLGGLQVFFSALPKAKLKTTKLKSNPFVSIHIAAYNEPTVILKNTLRALNQLTYKRYEVILLDNNTKDESIWRPVEEYCKKLGPKFHFFHVNPLSGFKAGALNYIRTKTDPKTEFIVTIDADYQVVPDFLEQALKYFSRKEIAFVQFPQSYSNISASNPGVIFEYNHFFQTYMKAANWLKCVGATGTLTMLKVAALKKVGEYNARSITEDADLGVRLIQAGYEGVYVDKVVGHGLMPYDLEAYKKQKLRWAKGNSMILRKLLPHLFFSRSLTLFQKIGLFSQLNAWLNFNILAIVLLLIFSILKLLNPNYETTASLTIVLLSGLTIYTFLLLKFAAFFLLFARKSATNATKAFFIHLGMNWVYSTAFIRSLLDSQPFFERTNKFILPLMPSIVKNTASELILALFSFILGLGIIIQSFQNWQYWLPLLLVALMHALILYVSAQTSVTKPVSASYLRKLNNLFEEEHANRFTRSAVERSSAG